MTSRPAPGWPALAGLLRTFLRPYAGWVGLVIALLIVQAAGNLFLPIFSADIINNGVVKGNVGYIWRAGGVMLAVVLAVGAVSAVIEYQSTRVAQGACTTLRAVFFRRVQTLSGRELSRFGIPSLITRNINDIDQVEAFVLVMLTQAVIAVIISIGGMIMAVREGPRLSLLLVVVIPIMALIIGVTLRLTVPLFRSMQLRTDRINQVMREQITGVRVIRAYGRVRSEQERFRGANAGITGTALRTSRIFAIAVPVLLGILSLSSVGIVWFGGRLVSEDAMPIGNMTAFLLYILQFLLYVLIAVQALFLTPRAVASAERIAAVLDTAPVVAEPARPVVPARATGAVEFRQVSFGYPRSERPVLQELTFVLRPGQTSAIIGGTGSGKTTLINLILRFFDATGGTVLVNGADVRDQAAEQLWSGIGLVPQTSFLFSGTVASNLRFARPDATDAQLWQALEIAQARDFVAGMPGQLDAPIDQGGSNVSGGQRQRLSIARALVRRSPLYLFDDCFSALDAATDARLRGALRAETQDAAVVIVAQRVSTIMHADQIIVLDAGRLAGIGTHRELLADCGQYREIVVSQLGEGAAA
ncbi:MAG TPA: ABC transporter ATP-binding protein [Streptosporangiaceae bacterium]|jgi:ATP-binding cassette subfamily B protein